MKTFETEFNELKNWLLEKTKDWQTKTSEYKNIGHDSKEDDIQHKNILEYNRRLRKLKAKYNKGASSETVRTQNTIRDASSTYARGK